MCLGPGDLFGRDRRELLTLPGSGREAHRAPSLGSFRALVKTAWVQQTCHTDFYFGFIVLMPHCVLLVCLIVLIAL